MKEQYYIVKEGEEGTSYTTATLLQSPEQAQLLSHSIRTRIIRLLAKKEMYPAEIAAKIGLHEQKIYYHIRQLVNAGILTICERTPIRGTVAKKYTPNSLNFCLTLGGEWKRGSLPFQKKKESALSSFLSPFIHGGHFDATFVVGSPDPHGPLKARARDSHYCIDLALFLGQFCSGKSHFSSMLDVDIRLSGIPGHLILVGGPV
ncbi:MAG: helix-turn-helix domain-containing protein, partial [Nanoarchaeota archaeon]